VLKSSLPPPYLPELRKCLAVLFGSPTHPGCRDQPHRERNGMPRAHACNDPLGSADRSAFSAWGEAGGAKEARLMVETDTVAVDSCVRWGAHHTLPTPRESKAAEGTSAGVEFARPVFWLVFFGLSLSGDSGFRSTPMVQSVRRNFCKFHRSLCGAA